MNTRFKKALLFWALVILAIWLGTKWWAAWKSGQEPARTESAPRK